MTSLKLAGFVCDAGGAVNEDGAGFLDTPDHVTAAWVIDGVTGVNDSSFYPGRSDAAWLAGEVDRLLRKLLPEAAPLPVIMSALVEHLANLSRPDLPKDYDPPACCLLVVRQHEGRWDALRIGDSSLLVAERNGQSFQYTEFPLQWLDRELRLKSHDRRLKGHSQHEIFSEFRPMILASRQTRNRPGGYGILEADPRCLDFVEYIAIEDPRQILLATDGFYRLVEYYEAYDNQSLMMAARRKGVGSLLAELRAIEADDPECKRFSRFKPRDDASAICLLAEKIP